MQRMSVEDISSLLFHLRLLKYNQKYNKKKYRDTPKNILYVTGFPVKIILSGFGPNSKKVPDSFLIGLFPLPRWFLRYQHPANAVNWVLSPLLAHQSFIRPTLIGA